MPQAQLEKKVADYLRKSQVLEDYWQRPITAEQLQAEMDRMAKHTKQPEVLHELFDAMGSDPFVIAECLVRPVLAERLFRSAMAPQYASQAVGQPINFAKANRARFRGYTLPAIAASSKEGATRSSMPGRRAAGRPPRSTGAKPCFRPTFPLLQ